MLAEQPDAVIVATGGVPDLSWIDGGEHCTTVWDVLADAARVKEDVIVFDGTGRHAAVSCALHLAEHGRNVQFVTLDDNIAPRDGVFLARRLPPALRQERRHDHGRPAAGRGRDSAATASSPPSATS